MKITQKNLATLINLMANTPEVLRDYCYYDGEPTDWHRGKIMHRENGNTLHYTCSECDTKRHFPITYLNKYKEIMDRKND